ncbi:hypothetical protein MKEN_00404300 [Mycena kentingensis (nom. inval.)]|nr:hypothetical protein MKEN_00404300 [Mycena kentingensis (nom. inval.)]
MEPNRGGAASGEVATLGFASSKGQAVVQANERAQDAEDGRREAEEWLAERAAAQPSAPRPAPVAEDSIPRPDRPSKVPMAEIRRQMDVDKTEWSAIRSSGLRNLAAACAERDKSWKGQRPDRIGAAAAVLEEEHPRLKIFSSRWVTYRLLRQSFSKMRSYSSCVGDSSTHCGRQAAARRVARAPLRTSSPAPSSQQARPSRPRTAKPPPVAGPSHCQARVRKRRSHGPRVYYWHWLSGFRGII